jgi:thiol-disulfide isomerase/thioredoxin
MKNIVLLFLVLISTTLCFAQTDSIVISGHLKNNTRFAKVVVKKFGVGSFDIAAVAIKDEKFRIAAPITIEPGVYRLQYSQSSLSDYVDIIINGTEKNITFELDVLQPKESSIPTFTASNENIKWYAYVAQSNKQLQKIEVLNQVLTQYPNATDKIVKQVERAVQQEQKKFTSAFDVFCKTNAATWAGAMVQNKPYYFTNPKQDFKLQDFERRTHYWDNVTTTNPKLLNTPLYTEHILNYLRYYMNPEMQFGEDEMNEGFIKSVNIIMQKFSGNDEAKKFAVKYLQLGFKEIGNEKVLQYIDQTYAETIAQCNDNAADKTALEKRLQGYAALKIGNKAPAINFVDANGNAQTLASITADNTIVVFWASWCPHCMETMPKLNEWAATQPNTKILAISLDDDKAAYTDVIKSLPNMQHSCDYKKWDGKAVTDYYIAGTPTFIRLDKDKKIIGKYSSFEELKKE